MDKSPSVSPTAASSLVLRSDAGGIATLTLNRPRQFNAISAALLAALRDALDTVAADPAVRVVVIAGAGSNFCAGHDLKEMLANSTESYLSALFGECGEAMLALARIPQPVIARVHGIATAAGCQLVAACDLAVASSDARFATSGINYGLFCATPSVPVSRNISRKQAFEMAFSGEFIDAPTALAWGLINRVADGSNLDAEVLRLAQSLMEKPPEVVAAGKKFFYSQLEQTVVDAYKVAAKHITDNMLGGAAQEGVAAFIEKRQPQWRNRKP